MVGIIAIDSTWDVGKFDSEFFAITEPTLCWEEMMIQCVDFVQEKMSKEL